MNQIGWIILRRMRHPLLVLVGVYSIAVLGMVLVPGIEKNGQTTHMDFFHAIYFVSYTSTTIGFGELPEAFSQPQRMWAMVCIYMSVIGWIYSIGSLLTLLQDPAFRQAKIERQFARNVRKIKEPFYLLCGYGEAGAALVQALTHYNIRVVVIDKDENRINELSLQDQKLPVYVPGLCADAEIPEHLLEAGLQNPSCARLIALTDSDAVNLKVSITSKLLNPHLKVVASARNEATKVNIASFGTEDIVDAFEIFAETMMLALHSPDQYILREWLSGVSEDSFEKPALPPKGKWIVCGYGRLGRYLVENFEKEGLSVVVIEPDETVDMGKCKTVIGRGTEADTLLEADVNNAVGIVAGTDNDPNNLSIIMTARDLNPNLFIVARQNQEANIALFHALKADMIMNPSRVLTKRIYGLLIMPELTEFLNKVAQYENEWARNLLARLEGVVDEGVTPDIWEIKLNEVRTPAVLEVMSNRTEVLIEHLLVDPYNRESDLNVLPLFLVRGGEDGLMPTINTELKSGDRILFCGSGNSYHRMKVLISDYYLLQQAISGQEIPRSSALKWVLGLQRK